MLFLCIFIDQYEIFYTSYRSSIIITSSLLDRILLHHFIAKSFNFSLVFITSKSLIFISKNFFHFLARIQHWQEDSHFLWITTKDIRRIVYCSYDLFNLHSAFSDRKVNRKRSVKNIWSYSSNIALWIPAKIQWGSWYHISFNNSLKPLCV